MSGVEEIQAMDIVGNGEFLSLTACDNCYILSLTALCVTISQFLFQIKVVKLLSMLSLVTILPYTVPLA